MTREEAIKYLSEELEKTEGVKNLIERDFGVSESLWHTETEAFKLAISALREQDVPDTNVGNKGCGWCKQFAGVPLRGFTEHGCQSITVKFCPMCGRRLEEI